MRIRMAGEERIFEGTPVQIVRAMKSIAFGHDKASLGEYVEWVGKQASNLMGVTLEIEGETDEEKAKSLVSELVRTGYAIRA
jgi:hypothetical protein